MVLGTTYHNAARASFGRARKGGPMLAFCNACLAGAALVGAVLAGAPPSTTPTNENTALPPALPSPESVETTKPPASLKAPTSVLLPPIQSPTESRSIPLPAHALPFVQTTPQAAAPPAATIETAPKETLFEVAVGQSKILCFPDMPYRVILAANVVDPIATLREVPHKPREWYILGKKIGTTSLDVWLPDPTNSSSRIVLHYSICVRAENDRLAMKREDKLLLGTLPSAPPPILPPSLPPPPPIPPPSPPQTQAEPHREERPRAESLYLTLEQEINRTFPGCSVQLRQTGESLVVSGSVRNIFEATRILNIARENAPGSSPNEPNRTPASSSLQATLDNYAQVGGRHVVNLLRIPGEQQIMLRVVVAEVNRAAARSLGIDFGLADKQATVLPRRPADAASSTVAQNGWIGSVMKTLQDLHYAQLLAEPTLTTLNGHTARFKAGGEFPIPVAQPGPQGATQGVAFRSYGVNIVVQPVVADADRIRLTVEAEVSGTDSQTSAQVGGVVVPGLKVRNFESTVELHEGETLAVAGLIRGSSRNAMPGTAAAGSADNAPVEPELVVLISPLLLHPPATTATKSINPLSPQEIERYLRSRNESTPADDARYLIGPQGYSGAMASSSAARR